MSIDSYLRAFKIIGSIVAAAGTLIPAYSFFAKLDPPILHGSGLITSASAAATCLIVYFYNPRYSHPQFKEEVQHLEKWPYGWYSRWIWEKDTGTSVLKRGTE